MINPERLTVKSAEALNEALAEARRNGNPQVYDTHLLRVLLAQEEKKAAVPAAAPLRPT